MKIVNGFRDKQIRFVFVKIYIYSLITYSFHFSRIYKVISYRYLYKDIDTFIKNLNDRRIFNYIYKVIVFVKNLI